MRVVLRLDEPWRSLGGATGCRFAGLADGGNVGSTIICILAVTAAASGYDTLSAKAEPVQNLGRLLEGYIGDCDGDASDRGPRKACREAVRRFRQRWRGRLLRVTIEDPGTMMTYAGYDARKKAFRLNLVPFFGARGFGMSVGRPRRLNAEGRPVMRHLPLWVKPPQDTPAFVFRRNLERGMVQLELVVMPRKTYRLRRGDAATVRGLNVRLRGLRLVSARSGDVLVEQTYQR